MLNMYCLFLLINISSIRFGYMIVSYWIALEFEILFQSVKYLGTSIFLSPDFKLGFIWKPIDAWVFFIYSITMSCLMTLPLGYFPSSPRDISISWRCCRRNECAIAMVFLNLFRVTVTCCNELSNVTMVLS